MLIDSGSYDNLLHLHTMEGIIEIKGWEIFVTIDFAAFYLFCEKQSNLVKRITNKFQAKWIEMHP